MHEHCRWMKTNKYLRNHIFWTSLKSPAINKKWKFAAWKCLYLYFHQNNRRKYAARVDDTMIKLNLVPCDYDIGNIIYPGERATLTNVANLSIISQLEICCTFKTWKLRKGFRFRRRLVDSVVCFWKVRSM